MTVRKLLNRCFVRTLAPCFFCLLFFSFQLKAQILITGKVTDTVSNYPLYPATVLNKTTGEAVYADSLGDYRIQAHGGDELHYSYLGFYTEKYTVPTGLTRLIHDVHLVSKRQKLTSVEVRAMTDYQQDSMDRIGSFRDYLDKPKTKLAGVMDHNTNDVAGVGVTIHPLTYFSKAERNKRRFDKMFPNFEKDAYIDSRYTPELVTKLTGLTGDSLQSFLFHFRPDYDFTRAASDLEFWSWIKNQYKSWIMPK